MSSAHLGCVLYMYKNVHVQDVLVFTAQNAISNVVSAGCSAKHGQSSAKGSRDKGNRFMNMHNR